MIRIRKSYERGHAQHGWLDSYHTFSFARYYDERFTGFRDLLVINEDRVQPSEGFDEHAHEDMEIISYVLEGELAHRDSTGSASVLRAGDVQRMSAGTGVVHSEFNHSGEEWVHFLQIWIKPREKGLVPGYEERRFSTDEKRNRLRLIASPEATQDALMIHQDVRLFASVLDAGTEATYQFEPGRHGWLQLVRGEIDLNGVRLAAGDGAAMSEEPQLRVWAVAAGSEFLLFDLS